MNQKKQQNIFLWLILIFTLLSIIPLFMISMYNHPSVDDFAYATGTHEVWKSSRNMLLVIAEAVKTSISYWHRWQGLYTSAFILALEPGIFGEQYYRITGFLTIGTLIFSNLIFFYYVLHKRLGESVLTASAFGMVTSFLMLHWMPSTVEGLFWYNGAMNYTFFFGLFLLLVCSVLSLFKEQSQAVAVIRVVMGSILAFLLSGGNHVTAFAGLLIVFMACVFAVMNRKKDELCRIGFVFIMEAAGFLLNVMSPGTRVRSNAFGKSQGVFITVWKAVRYVLESMNDWIGLALVVSITIMLPVVFRCVRRMREEKGFRFESPLLFFIVSVGLLAAMCCPSYYAMGEIGAGRLENVIYFAFIWITFLNVFYICGWIEGKISIERFQSDVWWKVTVTVLLIGMIIGCSRDSAGFLAWKSVKSGEALAYSLEADARYNLYIQSAGKNVEVSSYSFYPSLIFYGDITEDPQYWANQQIKEYYGLESVIRK